MNKKNKKPHYWLDAVKHLQSNDPVLSKLINKHRSKTYLISANPIFITFINLLPLLGFGLNTGLVNKLTFLNSKKKLKYNIAKNHINIIRCRLRA